MPRPLPHQGDDLFLVYAGTGTDLIFNRGIDLPGFASFPLLEKPETRAVLADQMHDLVQLSGSLGVGCILDAPTWMANLDRAAPFGYGPDRLRAVNRDAVQLMEDVRTGANRENVLVSACVGPRYDPYADIAPMSVEDAKQYHHAQLEVLKDTSVDMATAYTFNRTSEAIGCILAAAALGVPIVMSLVVETDGCLADGTQLNAAVDEIDAGSKQSAEFFMVNCAHPTHFAGNLSAHPRIQGVVANASKCSHSELDEATELDDGDPEELGKDIAEIMAANPDMRVIGGCCGTDMRHLEHMVREVQSL